MITYIITIEVVGIFEAMAGLPSFVYTVISIVIFIARNW